jgi:hypothetical protein
VKKAIKMCIEVPQPVYYFAILHIAMHKAKFNEKPLWARTQNWQLKKRIINCASQPCAAGEKKIKFTDD